MSKLLEEHKWSSVLSTQCIQEKVQNFQFALMQMYNDCFPVKTVLMSSRDPPFMSPLVKHLLKRRQALLRKGGQKQNPNVTILQERINKLIRENQLQAVKHDSNKHDTGTRSWWSISSIIDPASNNNNIFISYIKYTYITPPANSKANRGRWCVDGLRFITNS